MLSLPLMASEDETVAFDNFQRLVKASDPLKSASAQAVMTVMDRGSDFEKQFPKSTRLAQVHNSIAQTISMAFGIMGILIPTDRTDEVEASARKMLKAGTYDQGSGLAREGLQLILYRIATDLPTEQQRVRFKELAQDHTVISHGSAAWRASAALTNLDRLGYPLQLNFTAVDGNSINLADLRGKVILLDFWAPSCGPCLRDFPELREIYDQNRARGLEIIGLSKDPDPDALSRYLKKDPLPWPVKFDGHAADHCVSDELGIYEIPVIWLVDRHGNLCDLYGHKDLKKKIKALVEAQ